MHILGYVLKCIFKYLASRHTFNTSFKDDIVDGDYSLPVLYVAGTQRSEKNEEERVGERLDNQCDSSGSFQMNDYSTRNISWAPTRSQVPP